MANRILTKETIDRQLSGQPSTTTPFMKVSEILYNTINKKSVSFNTEDSLNDKIDKLISMMSQLTTQGNN